MPIPEAPLADDGHGVAATGAGWFVLNLAEARGERSPRVGHYTAIEPPDAPFEDLGINVHLLQPGQSGGLYHAEGAQEDFLVLAGECLLLVEEQERRMRAWDLFHCPAGTRHTFVGAGDGPCAILMVGARPDGGAEYPVSELAVRHGAGLAEPRSAEDAYAGFPPAQPARFRWPPA